MEKYNDPSAVDEISNIQKKLYEGTNQMMANIENALANSSNQAYVQQQTEALKEDAEAFNVQADQMAEIQYYRAMKLKVLFGMVTFCSGFCIGMPLIEKFVSTS